MARKSNLHSGYLELLPQLNRLLRSMEDQLAHLVHLRGLTLGVPIESRVKTWSSIAEKLERKRLRPKELGDISDLLGLRVIFLFQRDLDSFHAALSETFTVLSSEDTSGRLSESQFGYKSRHYLLTLPSNWEQVPSFHGLTRHRIEVQVRTLAQHIWAAASHKLQYKNEESVPILLRRSIYRVSALLETVDLEFSRLLFERDAYVASQAFSSADSDALDVTIVQTVLDDVLPEQSKSRNREDYADLLIDLLHFNINTRGSLRSLLSKHLRSILAADAKEVSRRLTDGGADDDDDDNQDESDSHGFKEFVSDRLARGVFFTHVGLTRQALGEEFGDDVVNEWQLSRLGDA